MNPHGTTYTGPDPYVSVPTETEKRERLSNSDLLSVAQKRVTEFRGLYEAACRAETEARLKRMAMHDKLQDAVTEREILRHSFPKDNAKLSHKANQTL